MSQMKLEDRIQKLNELKTQTQKARQLGTAFIGLEQATKGAKQTTVQQNLTKLDSGIQAYAGFKATVADLAGGLTEGLEGYVEFYGKAKSYKGMEKVVNFIGASKWADRMRLKRMGTQAPRENLKQILQYAGLLVDELAMIQQDAVTHMSGLQGSIDNQVKLIAQYEPMEEKLKEQLDAIKADYETMKKESETATPQRQAELAPILNEKQQGLAEVQYEYDQVFEIYNQAKQALKPNQTAKENFEQMVRDLGRQRTMIKEKMEHVTQLYLAAPEAVRIMMATKGMEQIDQTMNVASEKSLEMIQDAREGVQDATLRREEQELIRPEFMRGLIDRMTAQEAEFEQRFAAVREKAHLSVAERYNAQ